MSFWTQTDFNDHLSEIFQQQTFATNAVDRASYNLRLGKEVYLSSDEVPLILTESTPYVTIRPGGYALLTTIEYLTIPGDLLGLITLKYSFKKLGLMNVSGFHVDPLFHGRLVFSVLMSERTT
jgi:deoxycytidine triphosphate deaminase